jgi:hypothetical protein
VVALFLENYAPSIPGCITTEFPSLGVSEGAKQKQPAQNTELCISNVTAETLHQVASNMRKQ